MKYIDINIILQNRGLYDNATNDGWNIINGANAQWAYKHQQNSGNVLVRGKYVQMFMSNLMEDYNTICNAITASITKQPLATKIANKAVELRFHINADKYWFKPEEGQFDWLTFEMLDGKTHLTKIKYDDNPIVCRDINGKAIDKDKVREGDKVFYDEQLTGIEYLLKGLKLVQLKCMTLDELAAYTVKYPKLFTIDTWKNNITKRQLKAALGIITALTPRHQEEEQRYDADDKHHEDSCIYYKTYTIVDYKPINLYINNNMEYVLSNKNKKSKYWKINFIDTPIKMAFTTYKGEWCNGEKVIDENGNQIFTPVTHVVNDNITDSIVEDVTMFSKGGFIKYEGNYHLIKINDLSDDLASADIVLNTASEYTFYAAMPSASKEHQIIKVVNPKWINQFIGNNYTDKYTDDEIREIVKYSISNEDTVLELKSTISNAITFINRDITNLRLMNYKGNVYYRLIRDSRLLIDQYEDDEYDNDDMLVYNNDIEEIISTYNANYKVIGKYEYLIFNIK